MIVWAYVFVYKGGLNVKQIPNHPNYTITKDGQVWSKRYGRWRKPSVGRHGHLHVVFHKNKTQCVHRLVLETHVGPCPEGMECRHIDGNPANNNLRNLKWGTHKENAQDMVKHGTSTLLNKFGEKNFRSKLSDRDRRLIFSVYHDGTYLQQELADHFNIDQTTIHYIVQNSRWAEEGVL